MQSRQDPCRIAVDRMVVTSHRVEVPLDWNRPDGERISVHAREVVAAEYENDAGRPPIVWFQGGPGYENPFPAHRGGWLEQLLTRYRVVLLDDRGTGLSTPVDGQALPGRDAEQIAAYLRNFRQDSIVRDADYIRAQIYGPETDWYVFGHSFGGFCALTYLSFLPEHLSGVIISGGFAPVLHDAAGAYPRLFNRVATLNAEYYARFPQDAARVRRIVEHLQAVDDVDAHGTRLSARRFMTLGNVLGLSHGAAQLHGIVERAHNDIEQIGKVSGIVHTYVGTIMDTRTHPIRTLLHEGTKCGAGPWGWAAERARLADKRFALDAEPAPFFTGEAAFAWMFDELPELIPFREAAHLLAEYDKWPATYDIARLGANTVPVVGTVYWDDEYVERSMALETAALLGTCMPWVTNEYEHQAYRREPKRIADRLFTMLDDLTARA